MVIVAMIATTKNSTKKTLSKVTNVHDDHDDHGSASGSQDCLVKFSLFHCTICFCIQGCCAVFTVSLPPP